MDLTPEPSKADIDHSAHAPGRVCMKCDRVIGADEAARKRGESSWVHETCPI
ncbi:MAG TPA: hypothetical protein VMA95_05410 [Streptosporangiaceae bacterium]|nr:hypothetical protein [Streptosporangiaceae bacterium]